jgi:SRSO17 transposase
MFTGDTVSLGEMKMNPIHVIPRCFLSFFHFLDNILDVRNRLLVLMYILGLLICFHKKNATNIASLYERKHKSSFTRMLNRKNIADHYFLELSANQVISELAIKPGETIYLIIDSTYKNKRGKKLHNLKKFGLGNGKYVWGHCLVFGIIYYRGHRIPIAAKPYKSKEFCRKTNREFYTQVELGVQIVNDFVPPDGVEVIVLFDSFFSGKKMVDKVNNKGFGYVSVLAKNRVIKSHDDIHISERIEQLIQKDDFEKISFTHKGRKKTYFMHREELTISKCGNVVVVFSGREKTLRKVKALVSNMLHLSAVAVSKHYSFRWEIEIFFKELKQYLGLGDYQVRPYRAAVRHIRLVCMAYLFLVHFQLRRNISSQGIKKPLLHFRNRTAVENFQYIQRKLKSKKGIIYLKDFYGTLSKKYAA